MTLEEKLKTLFTEEENSIRQEIEYYQQEINLYQQEIEYYQQEINLYQQEIKALRLANARLGEIIDGRRAEDDWFKSVGTE